MKTFRPVFLALLAICAILCGPSARLHAGDAPSTPPLYIVLFRLTVGLDGKLQDFQVAKIIDLLSGSNNAAAVDLPPAFLSHAREMVEADHLKPTVVDGKPIGTLTSFLYTPSEEKSAPPGISFGALSGAMSRVSEFRLSGQGAAVSTFGASSPGRAPFFVSYYAVPLPKASREQREAIVEAEVQRSAANVQDAAILSRQNLSTDSQTIVEITCKTPRNKALTIRARYICNDRQMLAFTAITPDAFPAEDAQSLERLFEAFRFRSPK